MDESTERGFWIALGAAVAAGLRYVLVWVVERFRKRKERKTDEPK